MAFNDDNIPSEFPQYRHLPNPWFFYNAEDLRKHRAGHRQLAFVLGLDGGPAGIFSYDFQSSTTDDGIATFKPDSIDAASKGRWEEAIGGLVNTMLNLGYDDITELRADTNYFDRKIAAVFGVGASNASGFYYFDASSTASDDGGATIKPDNLTASDAGRWIQFR